jgi:hypothetical protein
VGSKKGPLGTAAIYWPIVPVHPVILRGRCSELELLLSVCYVILLVSNLMDGKFCVFKEISDVAVLVPDVLWHVR